MSLDEVTKQLGSDVLFELDSAMLADGQRSQLQTTAEFLRKRTSVRIQVEGHADERGTNEYNLALGNRRAKAVTDYLASLGIQADRMTTISKGEEQPVCNDHNEGCWSKNRRGHMLATAK
jgi:peptidoglycan-associated lipoprotein